MSSPPASDSTMAAPQQSEHAASPPPAPSIPFCTPEKIAARVTCIGGGIQPSLQKFVPLQSTAPSFDCQKAKTAQEKLICSDAKLSELDRKLMSVYGAALRNSPDKMALKTSQWEWLRSRDACLENSDCIAKAYEERIAQLPQP